MIKSIFPLLMLALILSACLPAAPSTAPAPAASPTQNLPAATDTPLPTPTATPVPTAASPTATAEPTLAAPQAGLPDISSQAYLDDRSTATAVVFSYFNAINRFEYLRAYSYYSDTTDLGSLDDFSAGYAHTQSVSVTPGEVYSEGAAGSIYSTVPVILDVTTSAAAREKYAACYVLRLPQPGNFGAPPITPLHLVRGTAQAVALDTPDAAALAGACPEPDYPQGPGEVPAGLEDVADLSPANYIDNRSGPVEVISSYLNAINRKEYVRAYSYWKDPAQSYPEFEAGYAEVDSITAIFGTAVDDPGAGQIYYTLPAVLTTHLAGGTTRVETACYTLHLSQPGFQGTPPFVPLGIREAAVRPADAAADPAALLTSACP